MKAPSLRQILLGTRCATSSSARVLSIGNDQGGAEFPQGAVSFADAVVALNPVVKNGEPIGPHLDPDRALGLPDFKFSDRAPCRAQVLCPGVWLGDGGSITLRFVDNRLTGSGHNAPDLWVFEVGADVEHTFVEISANGVTWHAVGKVFGSTASVDIDAYGWTTADRFAYVRRRDDPALDGQVGYSGADIDAVGAISTVAVPEPATWALMLGVAALPATRCRRLAAR